MKGVGLVIGLVELVKRTLPDLPPRWVPLVAVGLGLALNLGIAATVGSDWAGAIVGGLEAGLGAVGLYQLTSRLSSKGE